MRSIQAPERFPPSVRASIAQRYFVQLLAFGSPEDKITARHARAGSCQHLCRKPAIEFLMIANPKPHPFLARTQRSRVVAGNSHRPARRSLPNRSRRRLGCAGFSENFSYAFRAAVKEIAMPIELIAIFVTILKRSKEIF
jgi:hypothetical protein